jgi:hypothetical protein
VCRVRLAEGGRGRREPRDERRAEDRPDPEDTICPTAFPVEKSERGRSLPTITTAVVNRRLKPMPSNTASIDRTVGSDTEPHSRKVRPDTMQPAM